MVLTIMQLLTINQGYRIGFDVRVQGYINCRGSNFQGYIIKAWDACRSGCARSSSLALLKRGRRSEARNSMIVMQILEPTEARSKRKTFNKHLQFRLAETVTPLPLPSKRTPQPSRRRSCCAAPDGSKFANRHDYPARGTIEADQTAVETFPSYVVEGAHSKISFIFDLEMRFVYTRKCA